MCAVRLAERYVNDDVVEALRFLLYEAERGEVVGFAYVAQLRHNNYISDTAGESHRNPMFSLGMVRILEEGIVHQVRYPETV